MLVSFTAPLVSQFYDGSKRFRSEVGIVTKTKKEILLSHFGFMVV